MIFDKQSLFSDAQSLAGAAGTRVSTNTIDRGAQGVPQHATAVFKADLGKGTSVPIRAQIVTKVVGGTSVEMRVQVATNAAFTSPVTVATTGAIAVAKLVAGYVFGIDEVPLGTNERFIRLAFVTVGTNLTAGAVTAGIVWGTDERWS